MVTDHCYLNTPDTCVTAYISFISTVCVLCTTPSVQYVSYLNSQWRTVCTVCTSSTYLVKISMVRNGRQQIRLITVCVPTVQYGSSHIAMHRGAGRQSALGLRQQISSITARMPAHSDGAVCNCALWLYISVLPHCSERRPLVSLHTW